MDRVEPNVLRSSSNAAAAPDLIDGLGRPDKAVPAQLLNVELLYKEYMLCSTSF